MPQQSRKRAPRLRVAVRYLLERDELGMGSQSRLAEYFHVSRQFVHQIVVQERRNLAAKDVATGDDSSTTAA